MAFLGVMCRGVRRRNGRHVAPTREAGDARPRAARVIVTRGGRERQGAGGAPPSRRIIPYSRMLAPHVAETLTRRMNLRRINGLARACARYPQACQQNLWVSGAAHGRHVCGDRDVHRRGVVMRSAAMRCA
ncbi:hypothetical protein [Burkholderia pyrrocinia]|uniref:hypothetical protein n=1 Tax=Burkholderia pyrrocinia TaxID=60550 RepID=UPI001269F88E|nr:hypothetical protein [Burkholderia pyrrocinia]